MHTRGSPGNASDRHSDGCNDVQECLVPTPQVRSLQRTNGSSSKTHSGMHTGKTVDRHAAALLLSRSRDAASKQSYMDENYNTASVLHRCCNMQMS